MPKFYAGAPIVSTEGFVLGSFCVFDDEPKKIDHIKLDGLRLLADQFVQLLETLEEEDVQSVYTNFKIRKNK